RHMRVRHFKCSLFALGALAPTVPLFGCSSSDSVGGAAGGAGGISGAGGVVSTGGIAATGGAPADGGDVDASTEPTDGGALDDGGAPDGATLPPFEGAGDPWTKTVPRATCRTDDKSESGGVQGLGTDVRCNLDIVGQVPAPHFLSLAWQGRCAYVNDQTATHVVDVSDP